MQGVPVSDPSDQGEEQYHEHAEGHALEGKDGSPLGTGNEPVQIIPYCDDQDSFNTTGQHIENNWPRGNGDSPEAYKEQQGHP